MLTGHGNEAVAVQAMKKGVQDYLIKGLNNDGLRQAVQAAIDKGILRRQDRRATPQAGACRRNASPLIAELKQQTAALSEANRRKDDFLAMLGHELRNPLAPLRNMLQVMRQRDGQDQALAQMQEVMERQVTHLTRLVDDLLDVADHPRACGTAEGSGGSWAPWSAARWKRTRRTWQSDIMC